jgi:hypothetical protein
MKRYVKREFWPVRADLAEFASYPLAICGCCRIFSGIAGYGRRKDLIIR